jgi:hypothetical protein
MSKRRFQRLSLRIPDGILDNPGEAEAILDDVDTDVAVLLSHDPALGMSSGAWGQWPIALFEPRKGVGMALPDGSLRELQAEAIIQAGFSRWRQVTVFALLPGWSVRQTPTGLELWDKGGIWARGSLPVLPARWRATAEEAGAVIAVYGHRMGIRSPETGRWEPTDRSAKLQQSRDQGMIAVGLVKWRPLKMPEEATYKGLSYNPDRKAVTHEFPATAA